MLAAFPAVKGILMRASEIFTPNKQPTITYVDDHLLGKAKYLLQSLETGAAVIIISGPSKSGKTVFIEKTLGRQHLIQVTGAGVDAPQTLWNRVFDLIGTPTKVTKTEGNNFVGTLSTKANAGVPLVVQGEAAAAGSWGNNSASASEHLVDHLQLLIKELGETEFVVFIDDFHYIPKSVQIEISNQIKEAVRGGVRFICASVPYHSDDVLLANADLRGRIFSIPFDYWDIDELKKIAQRGFLELNIDISDALVSALAAEAAGSPQLMQSLCLITCFETNNDVKQDVQSHIAADLELISRVCRRTATTTDYSSTVEKMKDGPKTRGTDRKSHVLKDSGSVVDVYPLILRAIASNPPELTIRYANLVERIGKLCANDAPSGSSVTGACGHMSEIANGAENRNVVEWDGASDVLDIRDPYLLFFLRWADWK
jgi:hypothetical protein